MPEKYQHQGKFFTSTVAMELIFTTFVGTSPVEANIIRKDIYDSHLQRGGLPPKALKAQNTDHDDDLIRFTVGLALRSLARHGSATFEEESHLWRIHDANILADIRSDEQTYPQTLGDGNEAVYLYYYPTYRENAERKRPPVWKKNRETVIWPCKIGETHDQDTYTRTRQQGREAPEKKVIALIMKTDVSGWLEKMIQEILKHWGRHIHEAVGTEWYLTSPAEVERIYHVLRYLDSPAGLDHIDLGLGYFESTRGRFRK